MMHAFSPANLERFLALRAHFREAGCCWLCQTAFAMIQVDRENSSPTGEVMRSCAIADTCRDKANAARKTMPARVLPDELTEAAQEERRK